MDYITGAEEGQWSVSFTGQSRYQGNNTYKMPLRQSLTVNAWQMRTKTLICLQGELRLCALDQS